MKNAEAGTQRFNQLKHSLHGISPKTLTERLKELEYHGLLTRTIYPEVPPRVEYTLTPKGYALGPIFGAMRDWGEQWTLAKTLELLEPYPRPLGSPK